MGWLRSGQRSDEIELLQSLWMGEVGVPCEFLAVVAKSSAFALLNVVCGISGICLCTASGIANISLSDQLFFCYSHSASHQHQDTPLQGPWAYSYTRRRHYPIRPSVNSITESIHSCKSTSPAMYSYNNTPHI